jgi:hypothetical protein
MEAPIAKEKVLAITRIHKEFKEIIKHDKCRYCSCFHRDVLDKVYDRLKSFNAGQSVYNLKKIQADFENWARDLDLLKMHG